MTTVSISSIRQPRSAVAARVGWDTLYAITAFPLGLVGFVVTVTGISAGVGTLIIWVGLLVLSATLVVSSWLARLERLRLVAMQGREPRPDSYRVAGAKRGPIARLLDPLRDPQMWLDTLWGPLAFVTGILACVVTVTWWAVALAGTTYWFWQRSLPDTYDTLASQLGLGNGRVAESLLNLAFGLIAFATLPWAVRGVAWLHASLADVVLNGRSSLSARVERAEGARDAAQEAEAVALRRLERDIHDGPQQRLVRLTMDLGRARRQVDADPEQASATIESALEQARETLDELRSLSRGIAPPLLVDRGLGVALDELVVRGAVPVDLVHELPAGLSPHVETAVYFTVSEALTNVAKHSGAAAAQVRVVPVGTDLLVEISDHGVGGAHLGKGQGLAGLGQRVAAVGGTLEVDSPEGGPTVVTARIPLG
nr:sensor histidine kinase [Aeromicrobium duanguangcaii]